MGRTGRVCELAVWLSFCALNLWRNILLFAGQVDPTAVRSVQFVALALPHSPGRHSSLAR